jgi:hypothetical protein
MMEEPYDPPLTESEKRRLTELIIEDLVYRTREISSVQIGRYIDRLRDIWAPR